MEHITLSNALVAYIVTNIAMAISLSIIEIKQGSIKDLEWVLYLVVVLFGLPFLLAAIISSVKEHFDYKNERFYVVWHHNGYVHFETIDIKGSSRCANEACKFRREEAQERVAKLKNKWGIDGHATLIKTVNKMAGREGKLTVEQFNELIK